MTQRQSQTKHNCTSRLRRRQFLAAGATATVAVVAGCSDSDDGDDGSGGGSTGVTASLDATSDDQQDRFSATFAASESDEFEIRIEAGSNGADVSLMPQEATTGSSSEGGPEDIGFPWFLDADEEITDTVEIRRDEDHLFWITAGQAEVEASPA